MLDRLSGLPISVGIFQAGKILFLGRHCFLRHGWSDVYGGWRCNYASSKPKLDATIAVDDEVSHQLERLQDAFADEWLWIRGDRGTEQEAAAYASTELPLKRSMSGTGRWGSLPRTGSGWIHQSHGVNLDVVAYLTARWPLDYGNKE